MNADPRFLRVRVRGLLPALAEAGLDAAVAISRAKGFRSELAKFYNLYGSIHWEIGSRAQAEDDFERGMRLLEELDLRTELGLAYLTRARLAASRSH